MLWRISKISPRGRKYYQYIFRVGDKVIVERNVDGAFGNRMLGEIVSSRPKNRQEVVLVKITEDAAGYPSDLVVWLPRADVQKYEDVQGDLMHNYMW